jgi:glycosyltransferase involved in cell wall biosynthesis
MKIAVLSNGESHTRTIIDVLLGEGYDVFLITNNLEETYSGVDVEVLPFKGKRGYFLNLFALCRILRRKKPDILHVHYATGYGTLGHLVHYHPAVLSVWGSDVFDSYDSSNFVRFIVKWNLKYYDAICCTSKALVRRVNQICPNVSEIFISPFCVDCKKFSPRQKVYEDREKAIIIGTVKNLEFVYGIDILIKAFSIVSHSCDGMNLSLAIVGSGSSENELRKLAVELGVENKVSFLGALPHSKVPDFLRNIDIFCNLSRQESFGVSVIEASACELPVIASNVGGLPEVVVNGKTGMLVPKEDVLASAEAIRKMIVEPDLARSMGKLGRGFVLENYSIDVMASYFNLAYRSVLSDHEIKS